MKRIELKYYFIVLVCVFQYSIAQAQKLVSQPFTGHTSSNEITIWCMFKNVDTVYIKNSDGQVKTISFNKAESFRNYLPVNCKFSNLIENKTYQLEYSFDNKLYFPLHAASTTSDTIRNFSFLAGSCAFVPTGFNGAIKPFTSLKIFDYMQKDTSDFMLWLGDNLYYILQRQQYKAQLKRNIKTRKNKKLSSFLHSKQHYAIWDDHDYGTNNSDSSFKYKKSSLNIFHQFWPNPENDSFNYYTFKKQDAQFFMLDDRYNKQTEAIVLGETQLNWLKNELLHSTAVFKFIGIGMQALNPLSTMECFYKATNEYNSLIQFIKENHISGVLFISGDRHHAELIRLQEKDVYPLYDFTTSPLTMYPVKISKKSVEYTNPYKVKDTYFPSYNYAKISVTGTTGNRKCTLELKDKKGKIVWKYEIPETELQLINSKQ